MMKIDFGFYQFLFYKGKLSNRGVNGIRFEGMSIRKFCEY